MSAAADGVVLAQAERLAQTSSHVRLSAVEALLRTLDPAEPQKIRDREMKKQKMAIQEKPGKGPVMVSGVESMTAENS